jgi:hypothetical protein
VKRIPLAPLIGTSANLIDGIISPLREYAHRSYVEATPAMRAIVELAAHAAPLALRIGAVKGFRQRLG